MALVDHCLSYRRTGAEFRLSSEEVTRAKATIENFYMHVLPESSCEGGNIIYMAKNPPGFNALLKGVAGLVEEG